MKLAQQIQVVERRKEQFFLRKNGNRNKVCLQLFLQIIYLYMAQQCLTLVLIHSKTCCKALKSMLEHHTNNLRIDHSSMVEHRISTLIYIMLSYGYIVSHSSHGCLLIVHFMHYMMTSISRCYIILLQFSTYCLVVVDKFMLITLKS